ncbi:DUF5993 family protein [Streptomyces sp. UNOC14_S4]|uniref:DUF5993 family protein n=1 Tax=Streptomyces sp. UNOC14_S4 TaxID=2872340 RepID=UPI001E40ADAF|nr:DUF5993 family protein [Streptomyces sp. UNOC14_S4]MCC3767630.1 hypothetical protein [Streptomyces sp. UNOC14_S4]
MDTLIFAGLLALVIALFRQAPGRRGRMIVLGSWWVLLVVTLFLLAHHITSSLKLGLSY